MKNQYPECEKLSAIKDKSQVVGEFLEWLQHEKDIQLCEWKENREFDPEGYYPIYIPTEKLLAEFFNIDLNKVEEEKRAILEELRKHG